MSATPSAGLFTDLYELTMMAGYVDAGMADIPATFDLFFRRVPDGLDQVVLAGVEQAIDDLTDLAITDADAEYLRGLERFEPAFLDRLATERFSCDVAAMPEGTLVLPNEPLIRVTGPLFQAQWVETMLINRVSYASLIASHALAVTTAAGDRPVLEFGARRAHGPDGALTATRAAMVGGCTATSNTDAGRRFDLPVSGTQAHSWIMAFTHELDAFRAYARTFPSDCVLLVDTYDTLGQGVPNAITVAHELADAGHRLRGIRLDSGDLAELACAARAQLDAAGQHDVQIIASGDLDAAAITRLADAPIDAYGVGTAMVTAHTDPVFSGVYKLAELDGRPTLKLSATPAKTSNPGRKQVWRNADADIVGLADDHLAGVALLQPVISQGHRTRVPETIPDIAARCRAEVEATRAIDGGRQVRLSDRLAALRERIVNELRTEPPTTEPSPR